MTTLALVIWLVNLAWTGRWVWILPDILDRDDPSDAIGTSMFIGVIFLGLCFLLAIAVHTDIYGYATPFKEANTWAETARFWLIYGLITLGLLSLGSLIGTGQIRLPRLNIGRLGQPRPFGSIVQWIGLIASILGIVSFYLDYLR